MERLIRDVLMVTIYPGNDIPTKYEGRYLTEVRPGYVGTQFVYFAYYVLRGPQNENVSTL